MSAPENTTISQPEPALGETDKLTPTTMARIRLRLRVRHRGDALSDDDMALIDAALSSRDEENARLRDVLARIAAGEAFLKLPGKDVEARDQAWRSYRDAVSRQNSAPDHLSTDQILSMSAALSKDQANVG